MRADTAISITLNGEAVALEAGASVADLLRLRGGDPERPGIALAVNDRVVRRAEWETTALAEGDRVEVITAFQGG